jgi:hypothetical protein
MKPDSTISAIRPSMIALVSTTIRAARPCAHSPRGSLLLRASKQTDALGRREQILPLGDRQAEHPEPEEDRDAERAGAYPTDR